MINSLKKRIDSADVKNLALFLSFESKQLTVNIISLASRSTRKALLNQFKTETRLELEERFKGLSIINDRTLEIVDFALTDFEARFKSKNHPLHKRIFDSLFGP